MKKTKKASKKKITKKKATKKKAATTKKKAATTKKKAATTKQILKPNQYFYLSNGKTIKSIDELKKALKTMDEGTFYNHVNEYKSDFAAWAYHVFKDIKLAKKIGMIKNKQELIKAI